MSTQHGKKFVISLFDYTGAMVQPWIDAGYEAIIVDIQHPEGWTHEGSMHKLGFDLSGYFSDLKREITKVIGVSEVAMVFSFTPCTDMAVSGARWFASKLEADPDLWVKAKRFALTGPRLAVSLRQRGYNGTPGYVVENPVSKLSSLWRKPNHTFHPHEFTALCAGDNYTKKTCLWTSDDFVMPPAQKDHSLGEPDNRIHMCPPGPERMNIRSATPRGFATAVFAANAA